jgi:uncharacterized membrane protein
MRTIEAATENLGDAPVEDVPATASRPLLPTWLVNLVLVGIVAFGIAARLYSRSSLWLDEALSVNISKLSVGDIFEALRHDGHPPLYYVLLHYWMELVGEGDVAVRLLSSVFSIASLPLAWIAGRRIAGVTGARWALVTVALSPYCVRYATETRMYSLVMLLALGGYLLLDDVLKRPTWPRLVGVAVISGLLLLSHYWSIWLLGAVGLLLLWRWWRTPDERPATLKAVVAVAAGGLLFLPWLPAFLYQSSHTGTPWGKPYRPTSALSVTLADMAGGLNFFDAHLAATLLVILCLVALFTAKAVGNRVELDLTTVPRVRRELAVAALTFGLGILIAFLTSATFQSRYAAVIVPLLLIASAAGVAVLPEKARLVTGALVIGLSLLGIGWTEYFQRTQSADVAAQVSAHMKPGDVVVYCPDQLGPGYSREMPDDLVELAYPTLASPERVDWVDYKARNEAADPEEIAGKVLDRAEGHNIFLVWKGDYTTFGQQCQDLLTALTEDRIAKTIVQVDQNGFYEPAFLTWIQP